MARREMLAGGIELIRRYEPDEARQLQALLVVMAKDPRGTLPVQRRKHARYRRVQQETMHGQT